MKQLAAILTCLLAGVPSVEAAEPIITTVAGGGTGTGLGDGGPATAARLEYPNDVVVAADGTLYISEGCRIRRVSPAGTITTYAGNGTSDTVAGEGEGVPATSVSVCARSLALDPAGNLYTSGFGGIRKVNPHGYISTVASGGDGSFSGDGGPAALAGFGQVLDMVVDVSGDIYFSADYRIRRIDASGNIETIGGNGEWQSNGDGDPVLDAAIWPTSLAIDHQGRIVFIDKGMQTVRRISEDGMIVRIAGAGTFNEDPMAANVRLVLPEQIAADGHGNLYLTDGADFAQVISPDGVLGVFTGRYFIAGEPPDNLGDGGPARLATLDWPVGIAVDASGNIYIADSYHHRVRKVTPVQPPPLPHSAGAFHPAVQFPVGSETGGIAIGDFNRDDRADVAVATSSMTGPYADPETDYRLYVFAQQVDGTLAEPVRVQFAPSRYVGPVVAVDLDLDGYSDIALANEFGINTYMGGPAGLQPGSLLVGEDYAEVPISYLAGHVDLDGWPDLVAWIGGRSEGGSSPQDRHGLMVFYGNGQGGSDRKRFLPVPPDFDGGGLVWADVNRDGRSDLLMNWVAPGNSDSGVAVFLHDGLDGFQAPTMAGIGETGFGTSIATGDFDSDGLLDVIVPKPQQGTGARLARLSQTRAGILEFAGSWDTYDIPTALLGRDMDRDGRDDLLIVHSGWSGIGYQAQAPAPATSWLDTAVKYEALTSSHPLQGNLASGDLNGDGCPDIAMSDREHGLQVLYGRKCMRSPGVSRPRLPPVLPDDGIAAHQRDTFSGTADSSAPATNDARGPRGSRASGNRSERSGEGPTAVAAPRLDPMPQWTFLLALVTLLFPAGLWWWRWR